MSGSRAWSQETGKPQDEALDALLQKLADPAAGSAAKREKSAKPDRPSSKGVESGKPKGLSPKEDRPAKASAPSRKAEEPAARARNQEKPADGKAQKGPMPRPAGAATIAPKDQELDDLLQKLGETKETPAPDDRPRGASESGADQEHRPPRADQPDRAKLGGKDKEIDTRLEELTGRRRKRNADDGERTGPVGQIIKEMRDVEQRLGKPDTGEGTRDQQKQIVKRIDTLIEEMKKSGSSRAGHDRPMRR
jgi:hypothetical protein